MSENLISEPMAALGSRAATEIGLLDVIQLTKPRLSGFISAPTMYLHWSHELGQMSQEVRMDQLRGRCPPCVHPKLSKISLLVKCIQTWSRLDVF